MEDREAAIGTESLYSSSKWEALREAETDNVREHESSLPPTAAFAAQQILTGSLLTLVNGLE